MAATPTGNRACEVCGAPGPHPAHAAREMMFGTREVFEYRECVSCGCLALADVPESLDAHYPSGYYSYGTPVISEQSLLTRWIKWGRAAAALRLGPRAVDRLVDSGHLPSFFRWTAGLSLHTGSSIADIGSGGGEILAYFDRNGFSSLAGFDPYLPRDQAVGARIRLRRAGLSEIQGPFALVMVHHAFEHMAQPRATMRALASIVAPGGALVIRTPVADSWAWRHYGVNWCQLDAPRHLFVHTTRSLELLARGNGFKVHRSFRDSTGFQFWGSELYALDLPLSEHRARLGQIFDSAQLQEFERRAAELNAAGEGDSICLVLRRQLGDG